LNNINKDVEFEWWFSDQYERMFLIKKFL